MMQFWLCSVQAGGDRDIARSGSLDSLAERSVLDEGELGTKKGLAKHTILLSEPFLASK